MTIEDAVRVLRDERRALRDGGPRTVDGATLTLESDGCIRICFTDGAADADKEEEPERRNDGGRRRRAAVARGRKGGSRGA